MPAPTPSSNPASKPAPRAVGAQPQDTNRTFDALCLAGCERSKVWLLNFLRHLSWKRENGAAFELPDVSSALRSLQDSGQVLLLPSGRHDVPTALRDAEWPRLLQAADITQAWRAWAAASAPMHLPNREPPMPDFQSRREVVAMARLALSGGMDLPAWQRAGARVLGPAGDLHMLAEALNTPFVPEAFTSIRLDLREALLLAFHNQFQMETPTWKPMMQWLDGQLERHAQTLSPNLRFALAERRLNRGDLAGSEAAVSGLAGAGIALLQQAALAWRGQWPEAASGFKKACATAAKETKSKRGFAPEGILQWYLLSLLAQPEPANWAVARKLCIAESGSRAPPPDGLWGLWAHITAVRLGEASLEVGVLNAPPPDRLPPLREDDADTVIAAAWLGENSTGWSPSMLGALVNLLHERGAPWKADLLRQACDRLGLRVAARSASEGLPWPVHFFAPPQEAWREALAAIEALGDTKPAAAESAAPATLQWHITLDSHGRVSAVQPWERTVGVRGPGKAKPVPLSRVKKTTRLDPRDAAVARCIEPQRWSPALLGMDVTAAAMALVGHPQVYFHDRPEQLVDLREALPVLEVRREAADMTSETPSTTATDTAAAGGEHYVFRLADTLSTTAPPAVDEHFTASDRSAEAERRNSLRIVRDAPERARLIRIGAAQRRVAELVAKRWAVPVSAQAELEAALRVLSGHFQLHSDAAAGQTVPSEARLRAQLSPQGEGLRLRLLVQPFGLHGPALVPGTGRARLLTLHQGLHLSTERDLQAEAENLASVVDALPFLQESADDDSTWLLSDPEQALAAVERLPQIAAVAGVDWPRGKPVRVVGVATQALRANVTSGADWFAVDGEVRIDESRVLSLQQLLRLTQAARGSRFVALGDGEYLSLTEQLRRQLSDLQALAAAGAASATDKGGLRLPKAAAAWLSETLQDSTLSGDKAWSGRLHLLDEAAELQPSLPLGLQADLRSYQVEGFSWMARLAHAGLGACLADDMGLGKTVQTLALLLHRAALGPALVVAPTSVCSNWVDEAQRFAPGLRVQLYGAPGQSGSTGADAEGGGRAAQLQTLGAGDLLVVSYALVQIDEEAFAHINWSTLVLDEAQALKNAATKRAKSVASLQAGFRLALTGTPVENRLADLWALMNLLNPGLLGSSNQFAERYTGPIERERDMAVQARLRRVVSPFLLRRTKAQVLSDLPPRTEIIHRIEPGPEERSFLEAMRRAALERVAELPADGGSGGGTNGPNAFHVLTELTRLRRAACDPRLVAPELGLIGAKSHEFEQLAVELVAGRHKALVFSQFTDFLKLLGERLDAVGLKYQYLDGSTPAAERGKRVAAFQRGEGDLFLISLKAGGFGLNLTAADYVLIVDPWWNPAAEDQALGRAHRIGQLRPVTVYRLVTAGSVEERIIELHRDKRALADGILEGQDSSAPLGADALRNLLLDDD